MSGRHAASGSQEPAQRGKRITESDEYAAFAIRTLKAMGVRCGTDPGALAYVDAIDDAWQDAKNLAHFAANNIYGYSMNEIARVTGKTRQSVQQRVRAGELVHNRLMAEQGGGTLIRIGDLRAARAERHLDAGVEDTTAGRKEAETYAELRAARLRAVGE